MDEQQPSKLSGVGSSPTLSATFNAIIFHQRCLPHFCYRKLTFNHLHGIVVWKYDKQDIPRSGCKLDRRG
jgi:hypothetical protein